MNIFSQDLKTRQDRMDTVDLWAGRIAVVVVILIVLIVLVSYRALTHTPLQ